jgi:hypothetical protein
LCLPNNYIEAVIVERADRAALRTCEERGMFPTEGELARVESTMDDYRRRLRRLSAAGVIRSFHAILVVPPLLGGDWVWAGVLATVARPLGVANALVRKLPFVTEIIMNAGLPDKLGPNLAMLFYSRDFYRGAVHPVRGRDGAPRGVPGRRVFVPDGAATVE